MRKIVGIFGLVIVMAVVAAAGVAYKYGMILNPSPSAPPPEKGIYEFTMKNIDGQDVKLDTYKGKVVMIVNTASKCGYTPFEAHGKDLSRCENYRADLSKRVRRQNRRYDESNVTTDTELQLQPRDKFCSDTFIVIIDSLAAALSKPKKAYTELADRFAFLRKIHHF